MTALALLRRSGLRPSSFSSPIVEVCDFDTIQKAFEMRGAKKIKYVYLWRKF
ncbi:MAG: hypothetical protein IPK25_00200 [Saprospiraceae bacterium]|nr:hypothetical protein [Saprospiraceae bacterium]MBK8854861.1 hypothetical protein [Saprospiraceae bacterium]